MNADTGTPFDPPGLAWTPISNRLVTVRLIGLGVWVLVIAVALLVVGIFAQQWWLWAALVAWLAFGTTSALVVPRQVRSWGYAEREDDLLIKHGVLARSLVVVPYGRMQYVDVQAGPVDRMFDLAKVQLHTASSGTDASIPGLPPEEASRLRDRLASRGESRLAGL